MSEIDRVSLKEWTRNRYGAQIIVVVGLAYSILMHFPHFMQYIAVERQCTYICHDAEHGFYEQSVSWKSCQGIYHMLACQCLFQDSVHHC